MGGVEDTGGSRLLVGGDLGALVGKGVLWRQTSGDLAICCPYCASHLQCYQLSMSGLVNLPGD